MFSLSGPSVSFRSNGRIYIPFSCPVGSVASFLSTRRVQLYSRVFRVLDNPRGLRNSPTVWDDITPTLVIGAHGLPSRRITSPEYSCFIINQNRNVRHVRRESQGYYFFSPVPGSRIKPKKGIRLSYTSATSTLRTSTSGGLPSPPTPNPSLQVSTRR